MDLRAKIGAGLLKFLKIGSLTVGSESQGLRGLFEYKEGEYQKAYETNVWAYKGINVIASSGGQLPIMVVEKTKRGNLETVENHPFTELLNNPNPFMTRQDLIELLLIFLESTGDAYWLLDDLSASGRPPGSKMKLSQVKEIWPLPSHEVRAKASKETLISGYTFKPEGSAKGQDLSTEEVLHVRYPSVCSMIYGMGAIKPVIGDIVADQYAQAFEKFIMKNLASNIVFLKTETRFTNEQREEYRRSLAQVFKGVRIGFMESGMDFATPQMAAKDLPFLQLDTRREKRILGALGVPPIMVGSEDAKYDNAEQQKAVFWENKMIPTMSRIAAMLTKKLHELGEDTRLSVVFDWSNVKALQPDHKLRADTAAVWRGLGYPLNGLIKNFGVPGMEEIDGGDVGLVSAGLIPLEDAIDPPEIEPEGTPEDAPPPVPPSEDGANDEDEEPRAIEKSGASDKAMDDAHWKRFIVTSEPGFRRLRVAVRKFFKAQKAEVLARVREHYRGVPEDYKKRQPSISLILIDLNDDAAKLAKKSGPILKAIYSKLGKQAIEDVGASISFNVNNPLASSFLSRHVFNFAFEVNKTTQDRLTKLLQEKFAEGVTQKELTDSIVKEFGFYERYRAARIARTESNIAGNSGFYDGMVQAGVTTKRWISSRDEKVRDSHEVADGQEVPISEPFDVGGSFLKYPGDPEGPPEEIINCRCTVIAARERS